MKRFLGVLLAGLLLNGAAFGQQVFQLGSLGNATTLLGKDWASPAAIGTGTPAAGTFTTVTANTSVTTPTVTTGSGPLTLAPFNGFVTLVDGGFNATSITDANNHGFHFSDATNSHNISTTSGTMVFNTFVGGGWTTGLQINPVAGADRNTTIAPSNGGNPTIGTTAGNLAVTPAGGTVAVTGKVTTSASGSSFAGDISVPSMTQTSAAQSGTLCYNAAGGGITYDSTVGCLTSSGRYKDVLSTVRPTAALATVMALRAVSFRYKPGVTPDTAEQFGFIAEEVAGIDPRLVGFGPDGLPRGVRYQEAVAVLAAAIQAQQAEIDALKTVGRP